MKFYTADLCDAYPNHVRVLDPLFKSYGGRKRIFGSIVTVQLFGNNKTLVELLKSEGAGRIAVVDVHAAYTAVVGDNLMKFAYENHWAGIVINGYVRDTKNTKEIDVGLFALGTCPKKTMEPQEGSLHVSFSFGGVTFNEGDYLYADRDGIILSATPLEHAQDTLS
ncbi:MAG TPA: S-adenosylmethionine--2-demethylmenaquinone methyltransferase [Sulfurospirillum cavolei]|uniref:4-hydroxy-4-methyl-2-oxoglutarate aldolase n=1 Tax=Sulfurospirillum cavolei TaxID=366522 RepID=A0A2D3WHA5_9BACT|nr:ribonuclease E activity regulator RraA [Sulfurospirillum cavolei]MCD8544969.1 ribonuclease E activity regulator RraA [Sulfurospirillum cavolei]DAB37094.1 MAG TPA: S-adenosylmethionine--2-demethylmenaquinone methyltransferase [Sulfurospirillum cavolei]